MSKGREPLREAALQLLNDKVRHARSFLGNAHVGAEHNFSGTLQPRSQRTGVVLTLKHGTGKGLRPLRRDAAHIDTPLCIDSVPFYLYSFRDRHTTYH